MIAGILASVGDLAREAAAGAAPGRRDVIERELGSLAAITESHFGYEERATGSAEQKARRCASSPPPGLRRAKICPQIVPLLPKNSETVSDRPAFVFASAAEATALCASNKSGRRSVGDIHEVREQIILF